MVQRNENQALLIWDHGVLMREKVGNCSFTAHPSCIIWSLLSPDVALRQRPMADDGS